MNYFELFNIPVQMKTDRKELTRKFFELSRLHHPDYFANATENQQAESLEQSAQLNKAYKTLSNTDATIGYVLQLKELLEEEEKYKLSPDFLIEMLEINERLADAKMENDQLVLENVKSEIGSIEKHIYEPVKEIIENYREAATEKELLQVKDYYMKKKYLERIKQQLNGKS
jgi:molecular chaperone HscB